MKKKTTFHNLFQKIVSEEEIAVIQDAMDYKDSARKLDVLTLINYLLCAAMNELKSYRDCADVGDQYGLAKVNFSTLSKKAGRVDYNIMKKLFHLVVSKCNRATRRSLKISKELLLVDSTTITVGKSRLPWPFITESVQESNCMSATLLSLKCPFKLLKLLGSCTIDRLVNSWLTLDLSW